MAEKRDGKREILCGIRRDRAYMSKAGRRRARIHIVNET